MEFRNPFWDAYLSFRILAFTVKQCGEYPTIVVQILRLN